jgi:hypothetical protein
MQPLQVLVITYAPTVFYHCQHCELTFQQMGVGDRIHRQHARESLPDDLRQEFAELSDWIHSLIDRHGDRVRVKVVDAASIEGFWKSLRYGARRYPFVVIDGRHKYTSKDWHSLDRVIERGLEGDSVLEKGGTEDREDAVRN